MAIKRQADPQTLSSICNFDPIHNWKFANVSYNDQIQTNPTYPSGGYIGNVNLSTDSNTYSTFEIIWSDGSLIPPTSNNALNPTAGTFKLALGVGERTLVEFENTITASQDDQPLNLMFLNGERVLNFNIDKRITAKNVVDDMLFWSDGVSEPRKININRSISGTDPNGNTHTNLINEEVQPESGYVPIRKEHVTVIRKSPTKPLTVKTVAASSFESSILTISGGSAGDNEFQGGNGDGVSIGESVLISYSIDYGFKTGDVLKIAPSQSDLPNSFDIRVVITNVYSQNDIDADLLNFSWLTSGHKAIRVEVLSITEDAPIDQSQNITWYSYTEKQGKKLFERKLPRFAYRYKYLDNEYSAISPFTDVIFIPGQFDYHPTEAYNKGMVNHLKSLELKDFVSSGMPKDVVQIDLLYKNDTEPNIYLIDSIKPNDNNTNWYENGSLEATWQNVSWGDYFTTGSYNVETENIYATLPSNQTLRPWDNVPKTAIAQEVTGSRLIYGNYTQGYDLAGITPIINVNLQTRSSKDYSVNIGKKSIKSLRSYDIGVVWGDKYGRETPVIAPSSGSLNVPKSRADQSNFINVELQESPSWAHYYKYYIKETSNEYYNLALGRVYVDGEDDNVWLAFPSIDRNKVDEDTYLILKKGIGENSNLITEEARFKIVAIENEAPEQIKTTFTKLLRTNTDASRTPNSCYMYGGASTNSPALPNDGANAPTPGRLNFTIRRNSWENTYDAVGGVDSVAMGLTSPLKILEEVNANPRGLDELYVGFSKEVANESPVFSTKYRVIDVIDDASDLYDIKLASPILTEDAFITDSTLINDNIHIHFWKKTIENKPEFDGRFFVKIHKDKDGVVENNLIAAVERVQNWAISAATKVFKIEDTSLTNTHNNEEYSYAGSTSNSSADPKTQAHWNSVLKFGTSSTQGYWFVDKASFAAKQPLNSTDYKNAETTINGIDTCDITSSINSSLNYRYTQLNLEFNLAQVTGGNISVNVGNGKSKGVLGMRGDHQRGGQYYLDLSYSKLEPHGAFGKNSSSNYSWAVGENSATIEEEGIVQSLKENSRFKIAGNDSIYKILGVTKYRLYNYMGKTHVSSGIAEKYSYDIFGVGLVTVRSTLHPTETAMMSRSENRRHTYRIKYELDPTMDPNSPVYTQGNPQGDFPLSSNSSFTLADATTSIELQFLTEFDTEKENKLPSNPAVFETEPKEDLDLNLYYEASSAIPTGPINNTNRYMFAPIGSTIEPLFYNGLDFPTGTFVVGWTIFDGEHAILLSQRLNFAERQILINNGVKIVRDDGSYTSCEVVGNSFGVGPTEISGQADSADRFIVNPTSKTGLGWFNCWSFGNGVESNRIGDTFNKPFITNGVKASATLEEAYTEEHRKYGLIYSGIYNSNSGTNNLNQFIAAEKITKDINPIYGSIQKLYSRSTADGDLITLCEDRILKILANKDAVFNADGNPQLTATNRVLGQAIPFSGEYGISKNPESFASLSYRAYFTDKVRGAVMRLSKDGLTAISDAGMKSWFRDNLKLYPSLIGSYDDKKGEYNLTLTTNSLDQQAKPHTVTFQENVRGWTSFKSFILEDGVSCANDYFTFDKGILWKHHDTFKANRNTFYDQHRDSSVTFIFNQMPSSVKSFETLNYEGTQSKITGRQTVNQQLLGSGADLQNVSIDSYDMNFELSDKKGWYVTDITTEQGTGSLMEFVGKEKKWFNYIVGKELNISTNSTAEDYSAENFSHQGIGTITKQPTALIVQGCTDENAFNYYEAAQVDDGSCVPFVFGCIDANASNYNAGANTTDNTCFYEGCTDPTASNYDSTADTDNGSCVYCVYGCTDQTAFNYESTATCDGMEYAPGELTSCQDANSMDANIPLQNCGCDPIVYGCTDQGFPQSPLAPWVNVVVTNTNPLANVDDGSCVYSGCADLTAEYPTKPLPVPAIDASTFASDTSNTYWFNQNVLDVNNNPTPLWCWDYVSYPLNINNNTAAWDYYMTTSLGAITATGTLEPCPTNPNDTTNCTYPPDPIGCSDELGCNHNPLVTPTNDDGSCKYCGDTTAFNWDGNTCSADGTDGNCAYCPGATTDTQTITFNHDEQIDVEFVIETNNQVLIDYISDSNNMYGGIDALFNPVVGGGANPPIEIRLYKSSNSIFVSGFEGSYDYEELEYSSPLRNVMGNPASFEVELSNQTSVTRSRQNGQINSNGGYNGSTLTLEPNTYYKMAVKVNCENDAINTAGNFWPSTSDWNYNVKTLQTNTADVYGCTDNTTPACNYDENATINATSPTDTTDPCTYPNENANCDGSCVDGYIYNVVGIPAGQTGECIPIVYGCTDPQATNYDPSNPANVNAISSTDATNPCTYGIPGCTDCGLFWESINPNNLTCLEQTGTAATGNGPINFDPNAVIDDGSCEYFPGITVDFLPGSSNEIYISSYTDNTNQLVTDLSGLQVSWFYPGQDSSGSDGVNIAFPTDFSSTALNFSNMTYLDGQNNTQTGFPGTGSYIAVLKDNNGNIITAGSIMIIGGCTDSSATNENTIANYDDGSCNYETPCEDIGIGDEWRGGIVFELNNDNDACDGGKVVALEDASTYGASGLGNVAEWGCNNGYIGATSASNGSSNTTQIINSCVHLNCAAKDARNYTGGGYTDWYLPARQEFTSLWVKVYTAQAIQPAQLNMFLDQRYWTSTETASNTARQYIMDQNTTGWNLNGSGASKNLSRRVRPMRKF